MGVHDDRIGGRGIGADPGLDDAVESFGGRASPLHVAAHGLLHLGFDTRTGDDEHVVNEPCGAIRLRLRRVAIEHLDRLEFAPEQGAERVVELEHLVAEVDSHRAEGALVSVRDLPVSDELGEDGIAAQE